MPPPSAASFPSTFAAQSTQGTRIDLSTPDDRRVVVKLDPTYIDHYHTLTPSVLRDRVASHIHASTDPNIASLRVAAAKQLRSGDLAIYTQTVAEKEALQTNPSWAKAFGASKVVATTYGVIAHGIPANSIRMDDQKQTCLCRSGCLFPAHGYASLASFPLRVCIYRLLFQGFDDAAFGPPIVADSA